MTVNESQITDALARVVELDPRIKLVAEEICADWGGWFDETDNYSEDFDPVDFLIGCIQSKMYDAADDGSKEIRSVLYSLIEQWAEGMRAKAIK